MVKKMNMKGGGNEVIILIAVLLICVLIGGAAFAFSQDDLEDCPSGSNTTVVTDKCKCSDGHDCETGKYCYDDGTCNSSAETTSPPLPTTTTTNCSDGVSTDEATCIAITDCQVFPATDPATTTGAACVWTPPVVTGGGGPPPAVAAPCFNAGTCDNIGGSYVCKKNTRNGTGYYQKENGSSQDADFCSECPPSSTIRRKGDIGIESCVCSPGKYLQDGVCQQCGAHTVYDGSSCVCDRGENYITDGASGNCIPNTAGLGNNILTETDFTDLHPSQYNILVGAGYPSCKVGANGCQANQVNIDILNNLVVRDASGWKNRDDQSIITAGMELICPDGESLTRTGNIISCESNQCMVSSSGSAGTAVDFNHFPGVGCIESNTLNSLFSLNADNTDISIYDASGTSQSVKDTLAGLCSDGKTCDTSSPDSCDVLSDKVVADHSAQHGLTLFDAYGDTCQCPISRRSPRTSGDQSIKDVCNPSCEGQTCQTQATITNSSGIPTTYEIATPGALKNPDSCMCPACINGFTNDPVTGECTVDSGTGRGAEVSSAYDNGRGFCQNETQINAAWTQPGYDAVATGPNKSELKNSDEEYLSRSYKSGSEWIHECAPVTDGDPAKLSNKYNPFTRYKCEINQFLNSSGNCQTLSRSCANNLGTTVPNKFIGKYRKYSPECSIQAVGGGDPDTVACCESCGPHTADGPWSHPEIFDNTSSGFYNAVELKASDANNSGVGYNTRPMLHNVVTQSEDLTLSPATTEEIKKNLFVCQKTNFTGGSGELWGGSDIGAPTTTTTGLDPECQTPNNPNTYECQNKFKYFDSTTRTAGTSGRYLWMKSGDEYNYPEGMPDGCPAIAAINGQNIPRTEGPLSASAGTNHYDANTAYTAWNQMVTDWGTNGWQVQSSYLGGDCPTLGSACFQPTNGTGNPRSCGTEQTTPDCFDASKFSADDTHQSIQTWKRVAEGTTETNNHSVKCHAQMAYMPHYGATYDDQIRAKYSYYTST
jgi:hypothetical protein